MISIAICDDDSTALNHLIKLLNNYVLERQKMSLNVLSFLSPLDALFSYNADIYLLDIMMPNKNGLQLCEEIKNSNPNAKVIFCSSCAEFALEAYDLRAVHYLIKPIKKEKLFSVLDEILKIRLNHIRKISIVTKEGIIVLNEDDIVYLEYTNHKIKFVLFDERVYYSVTSRVPFSKQIEKEFNSDNFLCPHQAFLVNKKHITKYRSDSLTVLGNAEIPVSKLKRTEVKLNYMDYLSRLSKKEYK